ASIVCSVMDLLQPWPLKIVIDNVLVPGGSKKLPVFLQALLPNLASDRVALLNATALSLIAIALAGAVGSYIQNMTMTSVGQWVMHDLRTTLYHHIQRLSLSYHDESQTGDLISRVTSDIDTIQNFVTSTLLDALLDVLMLVGMVLIMSAINLKFTLIALTIAPFLFAFVYKYSHRIKKASRAVRKKEREIKSTIQETFSLIRVVKGFAREK